MFSKCAVVLLAIVGVVSAQVEALKPKPKPPPPPRCADVLLYDTYGDGWNADVVFQAGEVTYQLLDAFDSNGDAFPSDQQNCSTRVLKFCNPAEKYEFSVDTVNNTIVTSNSWEIFWAVKYDHKMYFGTIGSSVVIKGSKVDYSDLFDESPRSNECPVCNTSGSGLQITLRDASGDGWYSKGHSDVAGFSVPNVLTYPRFVVTSDDGSVVSEGTLCSGEQIICTDALLAPNTQTYVIRFSGLAEQDETWEFCGTTGFVGEQLEFTHVGNTCTPVSKTSNSEQCYSTSAPIGPHSVEVVTQMQVLAEEMSKDLLLTNMLSYFLAGIAVCCLALLALKMPKKAGFERLPTESAHSTTHI